MRFGDKYGMIVLNKNRKEKRMTRIILTVSCVGKTTLTPKHPNLYDFDQHTMDYKWSREGFEHIPDEYFKGMPGRTMIEGL